MTRLALVMVVCFVGFPATAEAQVSPPDLEALRARLRGESVSVRRSQTPSPRRETVKDEQGLEQWVPFEPAPCGSCAGKKTVRCSVPRKSHGSCRECRGKRDAAPCRDCAGGGQSFDPFEEVTCLQCSGSSCIPCRLCGGRGTYKQAGVKKDKNCGVCKGNGSFQCGLCRGKRTVALPKPGSKPLGEANAAALRKLLDKIATAEEVLNEADADTLAGTLAKISAVMPRGNNQGGTYTNIQSRLTQARRYAGYEGMRSNVFQIFVSGTAAWLDYQKAVVQACLDRLLRNEKVGPKDR